MVDNRGNAYRTRAALTAGIVLIGAAVALIAYMAAGLALLSAVGVFVLILGVAVFSMSFGYSSAPDKFGPSERDYRLAMGLVIALIGAVLLMTGLNLEWYWLVAILIIGIAVIGMMMAAINSRKIGNE